MRGAAESLLTTSDRTLQQAENALHGSNEASANVATAAAAAEELANSIKEISRQLTQADETVRNATASANTTNDEITTLAKVAQRIGDVVKLIQDIAEQTNLLALNAPRSRLRALVKLGAGFAVVASEVKSLSVQNSEGAPGKSQRRFRQSRAPRATRLRPDPHNHGTQMQAIQYTNTSENCRRRRAAGTQATGQISYNIASAAAREQGGGRPRSAMSQLR